MEPIDHLISSKWIIPVIPRNTLYEDCAIAINKGRILAILPDAEAHRRFIPTTITELPHHVVIPGLINLHGHAAMSLLRGYADDYSLQNWLSDHIWPTEEKFVSETFVRDGTELAIAEMLQRGTTCFADMYFFPDRVAQVALSAGVRAQVAFPLIDFPTAWAKNAEDYLHKGLQLHDEYKGNDLVKIAFGPHSLYTISHSFLEKTRTYAEELDSCIHIHLHETAHEVEESLKSTGKRPLEQLHELGLLSPQTQCVHMTQIDVNDLALLQTCNAHVVHCPESNLKLASGFCPVDRLLQTGINVALGTDGAASNNNLDMFAEMHTAALLAKAVAGDPKAVDAHTALEMATINGARALGLDEEIGSLEKGKSADIAAVDLSGLESQPLYSPLSQLIYTSPGHRVSHVWVQGRTLLESGKLKTLHSQEITAKAKQWHTKITAGG